MPLFLHALGHAHPQTEISNRFLEELDIGVDTPWILERTGIHSRRTSLPLSYLLSTRNRDPREAHALAPTAVSDLATRAVAQLFERCSVPREAVGMLIAGSSAGDLSGPAQACQVARSLELELPCFDVNSACTSFFAALWSLQQMDPAKLPAYVLVVAGEALTRCVDYSQPSAAVLLGDGCVAALVSLREPSPVEIRHCHIASNPAAADKARIHAGGHFWQDGRTVQMFAVRRTALEVERLRALREPEAPSLHFIGHQANLRMLESACRQAGIADGLHHFNVDWFGNTGCASAGSVLSQQWEKWQPGDEIALVGVGGGLTWSSCIVRWQAEA